MPTYEQVRSGIRDGDVVLCKSRSPIAVAIRVLTGESYNHVGLFVWMGDSLYIAEMRELVGFRLVPASQWMAGRKGEVMLGEAPQPVRGHVHILLEVMRTRYENPRYGYWELAKVWWSQLRNRPGRGAFVCSTFVQHLWQVAGFGHFKRLADPGDIAWHCATLVPVGQVD